jgi:ferredoxin
MARGLRLILRREDFDTLLAAIAGRGYTVIGPTIRDGAIVYGEITATEELPVGWTDEQEAGRYRLRRRDDEALFGYAVGPQSFKQFQLPPSVPLWRARVGDHRELVDLDNGPGEPPRYAFIGARSCELHASGILDRVLTGGAYPDRTAQVRAEGLFVVAVQCGEAGGTCFCVSMGTGPVAESGFDLALTEVLEPDRHYFVVEVGSERGAEVLADVPHTVAADDEEEAARAVHAHTAAHMGRRLDTGGIKELLYRNYEHPRWQEVADRCLTCGNCTMVCPTCFCTTVEDITDLDGSHVERHQRWDSCFTVDYSQLSSGPVRASPRSRYRQWMTHKLATWWDQFDSSGCVGCGRCITWCPVGIDITEEAAAIRADDATTEPPE